MRNRQSKRRQYRVVMRYKEEHPNGMSSGGTVDFGPFFTLATVNRTKAQYQRVIDIYNEDEQKRGSGIFHSHTATVEYMDPEWKALF